MSRRINFYGYSGVANTRKAIFGNDLVELWWPFNIVGNNLDPLSSWQSVGSFGSVMTAASGEEPTLIDNVSVGGGSVLFPDFNGVTDRMLSNRPKNDYANFSNGQGFTYFVGKSDSSVGSDVFMSNIGSARNGFLARQLTTGGTPDFRFQMNTLSSWGNAVIDYDEPETLLYSAWFMQSDLPALGDPITATSTQGSINSPVLNLNNDANIGNAMGFSNPDEPLWLGYFPPTGQYADVKIVEIGMVNRTTTLSERTALYNALQADYGTFPIT